MAKNRAFYMVVLFSVIGIYIATNTYYGLLLLAVVLILPVISLGLLIFSGKKITVDMNLPISMEQEGDTRFYFLLANEGLFSVAGISMEILWENQLTLHRGRQRVVASVAGRREEKLFLEMREPSCGATVFSVEGIRIFDVLGIFALKMPSPDPKVTVIYPRLRSMETEMDKSVETMGEGVKYSAERSGLDVSEIFSLKEYVPGDEVRKIHWKLSSKLDKFIVREFSLPLNYSVFLLIELVRDEEERMNRSVETFLSLSRSLLEEGIHHNVAWFDGGEEIFHVNSLDVFEDLEFTMADLLSSFSYEENSLALDHYILENYINPHATLVYVTSKPEEEKILETRMIQPVQLIEIKGEDS